MRIRLLDLLFFACVVLLWPAAIWGASARESSAQASSASVVIAPGHVERAGSLMQIGTAASGTVAELAVQQYERVKAGQLLVRLDCTGIQKELDAKTSTLAASDAVLARVVKGPRPEEIASATAAVRLAEARVQEAQASLQRFAPSENITITEAQLDQTKRDAKIAAAQLDEARARLALLQAGSTHEDVLEAQSKRAAANALVGEAAARLDQCSVKAPTDGLVLGVHVTLGQFVSSNKPVTLLTLIDSDKRRIRADVEERDLAQICPRQRAVVTAEGFSDVQIRAVTERISEDLTRLTTSTGSRTRRDRDVREVLLSLTEVSPNWPVGLRVMVRFDACPAEQGSARK